MSPIYSTIKKWGLPRGAKRSGGTTLIEMILYLTLLILIMGIIAEVFISMSQAYKKVKVSRELEVAGTLSLEAMLREARNASSIDLPQSSLGVSPGALALSGQYEDLTGYTVSFSVSSGVLLMSRDGGPAAPLTSSSTRVTYLKFSRLASSTLEAVRIEMEISNAPGAAAKSEKFYGFTSLRGSF